MWKYTIIIYWPITLYCLHSYNSNGGIVIRYDKDNKKVSLISKRRAFAMCHVPMSTKIRWVRNITYPRFFYLHWNKGVIIVVHPTINGKSNRLYKCNEENITYATNMSGLNVYANLSPGIAYLPCSVRENFGKIIPFHSVIVTSKNLLSYSSNNPNIYISILSVSNIPSTKLCHCKSLGTYQLSFLNIVNSRHKRKRRFIRGNSDTPKCGDPRESETDVPAGSPWNITITCQCINDTEKFFYEVIWQPPESREIPVISYHITFYKFGLALLGYCFKVPNNVTSFQFDEAHGYTDDPYTVSVIAEPIRRKGRMFHEETFPTPECHVQLAIVKELANGEVNAGENFTFTCHFKGKPQSIIWKFSSDIDLCHHAFVIDHKDNHLKISDDNKTLHIVHALREQSGCYICSLNSGVDDAPMTTRGYLQVWEEHAGSVKIGTILGGVFGGTLFIFCIIFLLCMCLKRKIITNSYPLVVSERSIYISHCSMSQKRKDRVVKFASLVQSTGIHVVIDLCQQAAINDVGGMAQWINNEMNRVGAIVVVLCEDYIRLVKSHSYTSDKEEDVRKISAEFKYIKTMIYEHFNSPQLIIISDGVEPQNFPDLFLGRPYHFFPSRFHGAMNDPSFRSLFSVILGQPFYQLSIQQ